MMTDLKQQLETVRDRLAYSYEAPNHINCYDCCQNDSDYEKAYKSGFNAAIPIIIELANTLEKITRFAGGCNGLKIEAHQALNSLKKFVEVTNDKT